MKITERTKYPKRRKLTKLNDNFEEIADSEAFYNIEDVIEPDETGTQLNAETLEKINWRDDTTLSFKALSSDSKPEPKIDEAQIYTNSKGTFLMMPGNKEEIELGKTVGTTVFDSVNIKGWDKWNADIKQDKLTTQQMQNIADIDLLKQQQLQIAANVQDKEPAFNKSTAFNKNFATTNPQMNGIATAGNSDDIARGNHVHPSDAINFNDLVDETLLPSTTKPPTQKAVKTYIDERMAKKLNIVPIITKSRISNNVEAEFSLVAISKHYAREFADGTIDIFARIDRAVPARDWWVELTINNLPQGRSIKTQGIISCSASNEKTDGNYKGLVADFNNVTDNSLNAMAYGPSASGTTSNRIDVKITLLPV